ncbi:MAG: SH3 domain-containing protein [Chloroflexota bacterium]
MNIQSLIPYIPFLAVLYLLFALMQALRHKQQGFFAALLAFIALAVPLAALILTQDTIVKSSLESNLTLNAVIVFVGSIIVLMIERGNTARAPYHSYGMLGIGLGVLIAIVSLGYPILISSTNGAQGGNRTGANNGLTDGSTIQNVSQTTGATTESSSAFADVLTAQTGLTADAITTQIQSGSKIADLVSAHNGDVNAVITAAATALDALKAQGGRATQFLSNLGDDSTAIATQFVQGTLEARAQQFMTRALLSGGVPAFGQNGQGQGTGTGASGTSGFGGRGNGVGAVGTPGAESTVEVVSVPTAQPTQSPAMPTEVTIRPTLITFPSPTPTPVVTQVSVANAANPEATQEAATCTITPIYNLNLRDKSNTDGKIYLSIPYGTQITTDGRTADDWYKVTYNGQAGWVSGEYVSKVAACADVAVVDASS